MMKRVRLLAVPLAALLGSGIGVAVTALPGAAASRSDHVVGVVGSRIAHPLVSAQPVGNKQQWTFYDEEYGTTDVCEVLTFGTKTFSGDLGDQGKYKSSTKTTTLTFENGAYFVPAKFTGTAETADEAVYDFGDYGGSNTFTSGSLKGDTYGPNALVSGDDPFGWGTC